MVLVFGGHEECFNCVGSSEVYLYTSVPTNLLEPFPLILYVGDHDRNGATGFVTIGVDGWLVVPGIGNSTGLVVVFKPLM